MTTDEFRAIYERMGFTQKTLCDFLDAGERTVRRWAKEGPPNAVAIALSLMTKFEVTPDRALKIAKRKMKE